MVGNGLIFLFKVWVILKLFIFGIWIFKNISFIFFDKYLFIVFWLLLYKWIIFMFLNLESWMVKFFFVSGLLLMIKVLILFIF